MSGTDSRLEPHQTFMPMQVMSTAFHEGDNIPSRFTADGENLSPPLRWSNPPSGTRSLALVCDDPDAPQGTFVHWLAWNIQPDRRHLGEGVPPSAPEELSQGQNSAGHHGYVGPNPPQGQRHRYVFTVFALDQVLELAQGASREKLEEALRGHVLGSGTLTAAYAH
jgi:Raf kinase inhibitor-like YbhB/YbcL family protein